MALMAVSEQTKKKVTGNLSGRPPAKILTDHFKQLKKVKNRSNRHYYECKYCGPNGAGNRVEGRDNKPLRHILTCSAAPQAACNAVWSYLASKTQVLELPDPIVIETNDGDSVTKSLERASSTQIPRKRPSGTPLDREKQDMSVLATNLYLGTQVDLELELDGNEVLEGQVYSWKELEVVDKGSLPMEFAEDISVLDKAGDGNWDIQALLSSEGVAF
ncbi:hypothetical protein JVT61DRAFT_6315 [Boletus reticuloceps]|uniref:Uncharacterized protein n=1 Tax=Boletus reticuloceps TaxID=495285 RepID=A0A8I2YKR8_9AGAM|nr:hypothetical protein JVT61DRAFT_6315 [Boletus reticuloceps]